MPTHGRHRNTGSSIQVRRLRSARAGTSDASGNSTVAYTSGNPGTSRAAGAPRIGASGSGASSARASDSDTSSNSTVAYTSGNPGTSRAARVPTGRGVTHG